MKHLLEEVDLLAGLAASRVLLGFDFDGTLAPIVADREHAQMRERTRALLATLNRLYPCAVISGRARPDVETRLGAISMKYVIGNHGIEPGGEKAGFERTIAAVRRLLEQTLTMPGIEIEDKRYSLAVHYRQATDRHAARDAIDTTLASLPSALRVIPGKLVTNVLPMGARHKGEVLLQLLELERTDTALYIGDDVTDEDVFVLDRRVVSARVGKSLQSAAAYYLRDQQEIDALLAHMVTLRRPEPNPP